MIILFLINVIIISLPLAIFEIILEKDKGWGSGLTQHKWYGKKINNSFFTMISGFIGTPKFVGFQVAIYFILLPLVMIGEYFFITQNFYFLIAVFLAILATEDFFWFALNWNFNSLTELLKGQKGSIWWHKNWVKISSEKYLPKSYIITLVFVILFLAIASFYEF